MALGKVRRSAAAVMGLAVAAAALLSPPAPESYNYNYEVTALMGIKRALNDPSGVLRAWDSDPTVIATGNEPCDWPMVICNNENQVFSLDLTNQNLSGQLSPAIGGLMSMRNLLLRNNSISGPIPEAIGQVEQLETLDLSNNHFSGSIPSTLGGLAHLQYLELNNNSLSGHIPHSLATASMLTHLDLSFNNLSGPLPIFRASFIFVFQGNPLLNRAAAVPHYVPTTKPMNGEENSDVLDEGDRILGILLAVCLSIVCIAMALITVVAMVYCHRRRHDEQAGAVDDHDEQAGAVDDHDEQAGAADVHLGHLKLYKFEEMRRVANNNFCQQKHFMGEGGWNSIQGSFA